MIGLLLFIVSEDNFYLMKLIRVDFKYFRETNVGHRPK